MIMQIEREVREFRKELAEVQEQRKLLRFQPCRGDAELRQKDGALEELDKRIESLKGKGRELGRKRRKIMSEAAQKTD
jgi:chromosome segregation ATPase